MIQATNIKKSYNGDICLNNINLHVEKGQFIAVMGESGSGKSTLLEILSGSLKSDSGEVLIDGENIFSISENRRAKLWRTKIGVVYQDLKTISTLKACDNIMLPLILEKYSKSEAEKRLFEVAKLLQIKDVLKKYPEEMSGGQCQRVAIARALIYRPKLIFLDEPTGSLDSHNSQNVMEILKKISKEWGTTLFLITHSQIAAQYADKVLHIKDGKLL